MAALGGIYICVCVWVSEEGQHGEFDRRESAVKKKVHVAGEKIDWSWVYAVQSVARVFHIPRGSFYIIYIYYIYIYI